MLLARSDSADSAAALASHESRHTSGWRPRRDGEHLRVRCARWQHTRLTANPLRFLHQLEETTLTFKRMNTGMFIFRLLG